MSTYWKDIFEAISTLTTGAKITLRHLWAARKPLRKDFNAASDNYFEQDDGIVTMQYPFESIPVPDHGRYRLHNEIEDCIVCDKCADVCPVDCIDIESVRAVEGTIRKASDGTSVRQYATRFDIDMAKCCYCGLCTTVCPTECLTMTKTYDYSEVNLTEMVYAFSELTPEEAEQKKAEWAAHEAAKKAEQKAKAAERARKKQADDTTKSDGKEKPAGKRPKVRVRPKIRRKPPKEDEDL